MGTGVVTSFIGIEDATVTAEGILETDPTRGSWGSGPPPPPPPPGPMMSVITINTSVTCA